MIEHYHSAVDGTRKSSPSVRPKPFEGVAFAAILLMTTCMFAEHASAQSVYNDGGGTAGAPSVDDGAPSDDYLDGGGTPSRPSVRRYHRADDGFLRDGGSIRQDPDVVIGGPRKRFLENGGGVSRDPDVQIERGDARKGFLNNGGGIRREPDVLLGGNDQPFLSQGGSVRARPPVRVAISPRFHDLRPRRGATGPGGPGWRVLDAPEVFYTSNGSFTIVSGRGQRNEVVLSDVGDGGRRNGYDPAGYRPQPESGVRSSQGFSAHGFTGPKIIDVDRDSLASHPVPSGSIEILSGGHGGPKIIRIASDFGGSADLKDAAAAGAPRVASDERARPGEPWTREWLSTCSRTYASFDPQFGTYRDRSGAMKFCTGE